MDSTYELWIRNELDLLAFLSSMPELLLESARVSRPRWPFINEAAYLISWFGWKTTKCLKHNKYLMNPR